MQNPVTILLVEDDDIDAETISRSFRKHRVANQIVRAKDGLEGIEILEGKHPSKHLSKPYIALLDIQMPRMNGHEFLDRVRANPEIAETVVFMLTTSQLPSDISKSYEKHVAGYILKQSAGENFLDAIKLIEHYWRVVEVPAS